MQEVVVPKGGFDPEVYLPMARKMGRLDPHLIYGFESDSSEDEEEHGPRCSSPMACIEVPPSPAVSPVKASTGAARVVGSPSCIWAPTKEGQHTKWPHEPVS